MPRKTEIQAQSTEQLAQMLWDYHYLGHQLKPVDIILGLGSYELRVAQYCAELYKYNIAPTIIFSGNVGNWTKSIFQTSEAKFFAQCAQNNGVPEKDILLEERSTNIGQNISFSQQLLNERGRQITSIVVVTKPNTQRRAYATIKKIWPEVDAIIVSPQLTLATLETLTRSKQDIINEMVGDLQRIKIYPKLGYQIEQYIPQEILDAYGELKNRGYTEHLISLAD